MRLIVESDELQFFRARIGPGWEQPSRMRNKVKAEVVSLLSEGVGGFAGTLHLRGSQTVDWRFWLTASTRHLKERK